MSLNIPKPLKSAAKPNNSASTRNMRVWGSHTFKFALNVQKQQSSTNNEGPVNQTNILYAEAKTGEGTPLAIKCDWFRVRVGGSLSQPQRMEAISNVSTNVYQLGLEDVGYYV